MNARTEQLQKEEPSCLRLVPMEPIECVHHVPGRLRLRARSLRGEAKALERVGRALLQIDGVTAAVPRETTGSIIVSYDRSVLGPGALQNRLADLGISVCFLPSTGESLSSGIVEAVVHRLFEYAVEKLAIMAIEAI